MRRPPNFQRGMVLVSSLLLLVVVTILAVGLFRGFGIDEKIAGNTREKQRALQAAMSAQDYAEWWLAQGNGTSAVTCTGTAVYTVGQVCTNTLQSITNVATLPWKTGGGTPIGVINYAPPNMTVSQTIGSGTYWSGPSFYIAFLGIGLAPSGATGNVYQIDATGYGSSPSTAAVVESTYVVVPHIASCRDCQ